jgi:peptidoglycan/xylan/chitin deacetylase (PgdA/CDA1 family)
VIGSELFRPPYGHITRAQYKELKKKYRIIIWDLMPYDFDSSFSAEKTLSVMKRKKRPGSIMVLHDTPRSKAIEVLPEFIGYSENEGYSFSNEL